MPTGKTLLKVSRQSSKSKSVMFHPKGRKFAKLNKAHLREHKLEKKKMQHIDKREHELRRTLFFQEAAENRVSDEKKSFTVEEMKLFIEAYLSRFDEELEELRDQRRPGRPASKRQDLLEDQKKKDRAEYVSGFKVPDMSDEANVENLIKWNGTIGGVNNVKVIYLTKNSTVLPEKEKDTQMSV
ncbi:Tma16 protein [Saccharomycopsis crataegensis]|uniref:Tma16 protein n=1 Tax=Saccharomycopsis crataegensis TaxID=43959 RepID=A0AAV5QRB5_9ASCO|nr:Tma16 protein [Saccharomycopsis crataegensis]